MLIPTQGLVLHTSPYSESSLIVKVFTERLGVRSYIVKGARKPSSRVRQALLQPLSWLDMVVYDNPRTSLNYIKEYTPMMPTAATDAVSNALLFFMDELLYRTLREGEAMPELFRYVAEALVGIERTVACSHRATDDRQTTEGPERSSYSNGLTITSIQSLPIVFLITIAKHMGIAPLDNYSVREAIFSISEGKFVSGSLYDSASPTEADMIAEDLSSALHHYLAAVYSDTAAPLYSAQLRSRLIAVLIDYYKHHLSYFGNFKSHEILHGVLS